MTKHYDVTVVVGMFNPVWIKLKATLISILEQVDVSLQIVLSDDGSENTYFKDAVSLFKKFGFEDYKLVSSKKNEGTVCQTYRGVLHADADYVKFISPGDLFFSKTTLSKWLNFTVNNNGDITFCDAVYYNFRHGNVHIFKSKHNPRNMTIYLKPVSYLDRVTCYVILKDFILGAAIMVRRDLLTTYLRRLLYRVIYADDHFVSFAVLEQRNILYYPSIGIWYEYGDGGISTTGNSTWRQRLRQDQREMYKLCLEIWTKEKNEIINKWLYEQSEYYKYTSFSKWDRFKNYAKHPRWLYWKIYERLFCSYCPTDVDDYFLIYCFANGER